MMEYPKKKDLNNRAEQTSTFTNDRHFNDAISLMSAEIRRRCEEKALMYLLDALGLFSITREKAIEAIRKHFEGELWHDE
ncbi:hypothetical protein IID24_02805 [Patescibacteria group bacterium]|nr:hypothetical protein [Patescibacteria group bacterium]